MNVTDAELSTPFETDAKERRFQRKSLGAIAVADTMHFLGSRAVRRIAKLSVAAIAGISGLVAGGDYLAHRFGRELGQSAATTISEDLNDQHLPKKFVNAAGKYIHEQLPDYLNTQVDPIVTQEVNAKVYKLEKEFDIDINHDGYIGSPPQHKPSSTTATTGRSGADNRRLNIDISPLR